MVKDAGLSSQNHGFESRKEHHNPGESMKIEHEILTISMTLLIIGAFFLGIISAAAYYEYIIISQLTTPSYEWVLVTFIATIMFAVGLIMTIAAGVANNETKRLS